MSHHAGGGHALSISDYIGSCENWGSHRSDAVTRRLLGDLLHQFHLAAPLAPDLEAAVHGLLVDVVQPIGWYSHKIARARAQRRWYILGCSLLVVALPVAVTLIGRLDGSAAQSLLGQLSTLLTGVFALQKFIAASLGAQQRYGAWWKASSDLKKLWYGFESRWRSSDAKVHADAFIEDLRLTRQQGRDVLANEEADFFNQLTLPSFDILDLLGRSRPDLAALAGSLLPTPEQSAALTKARQDLARNSAQLAGLTQQLADARASGQDTTFIQTLEASRQQALLAAVNLRAELAAQGVRR